MLLLLLLLLLGCGQVDESLVIGVLLCLTILCFGMFALKLCGKGRIPFSGVPACFYIDGNCLKNNTHVRK